MKALLIVSVLVLLVAAAPTASASDPLDCGGFGPMGCVGAVIERLTGCNPNYQYFQPCEPSLPIP